MYCMHLSCYLLVFEGKNGCHSEDELLVTHTLKLKLGICSPRHTHCRLTPLAAVAGVLERCFCCLYHCVCRVSQAHFIRAYIALTQLETAVLLNCILTRSF